MREERTCLPAGMRPSHKRVCAFLAAVVVVTAAGCRRQEDSRLTVIQGTEASAPGGQEMADDPGTEEEPAAGICVFVCGAVREPGVYGLPEGARAADALEAAGGFAEGADTEYINLAQPLTDGQQLRFPTEEEAEELRSRSVSGPAEGTDGMVNINTAGAQELMTLPGIGESRAEAIIQYRTQQGSFAGTEEIMNVSGIGEAGYAKIRDRITVR